jgi:predicted regulator of Ras-like GTPase activity (Roadblock/LC7/MglB family)
MLSFFERVTHGIKGIKGFFIFGTKGTILDAYSEPPILEGELLHSLNVFVHSIHALKEFEVLMVEGEKGKLIVYHIGDLELGFYCDATINPLLLDITVKRLETLEKQIRDELYHKLEKLKASLKKIAHQYMGSAGEALIEKEFSGIPGEETSEILERIEKAASLLIGPTRASAMRNELDGVIGGTPHD